MEAEEEALNEGRVKYISRLLDSIQEPANPCHSKRLDRTAVWISQKQKGEPRGFRPDRLARHPWWDARECEGATVPSQGIRVACARFGDETMKRIDFDLPDGRERRMLGALLELHMFMQAAAHGPKGFTQLGSDPNVQQACAEATVEWAREKFPDIKIWIE